MLPDTKIFQKREFPEIFHNEQQSKDLFSLAITAPCTLSVLITLQLPIKLLMDRLPTLHVFEGVFSMFLCFASCSSKLILPALFNLPCLTCLYALFYFLCSNTTSTF